MNILSFFKRKPEPCAVKSTIFFDGDQDCKVLMRVKKRFFLNEEVQWIHCGKHTPKIVSKDKTNNVVSLSEFSAKGKETTDKYIAMAIQKLVSEGVVDICVVSSDFDFVDIFKMITVTNPDKCLKFKLIAPYAKGRLLREESTSTIEIIKVSV